MKKPTRSVTRSSQITAIANREIQNQILIVRGARVMLDVDLARIYGVTTKRLNEQVKRNRDRFPEDFMFKLTLLRGKGRACFKVANCDLETRSKCKT